RGRLGWITTGAARAGRKEALRAAVAMADGQPVLFLYEKLAMAHAALDVIGARPSPAGRQVSPEIPAGSAMTGDIPARPATPELAGRPAGAGPATPMLTRVSSTIPPSAAVWGPAPTAGHAAAAARAATAIASPAPPLIWELAAEAEQLVPPLTAAAERVASPAMLGDTAATGAVP